MKIAVDIGIDRNVKTDNKWMFRFKIDSTDFSGAIGACWDNLDGYEAVDMFLVENGGHSWKLLDGDPETSDVFKIEWHKDK